MVVRGMVRMVVEVVRRRWYSTFSRNGNRANGNRLKILGLRIGLICEIVAKRCQKRPIKIGILLLLRYIKV